MRIGVPTALAIAALVFIAAWQRPVRVPFGFTHTSAVAEADLERRFLALPSADRIRDEHRVFAGEPHMAGTERDRNLAARTGDQFARFGLEDVEVTTHEVLLPWPQEGSGGMISPLR